MFKSAAESGDCLAVLKLHGSLNWYSSHNSRKPPRTAMLKPSRTLHITTRSDGIRSLLALPGGGRKTYGLPVVVPPVSHKSAVLHERLNPVWQLAEERLAAADEIVVFGYSCPALDFESANLLRRSQLDGTPDRRVSIIDPNPAVVARYVDLMKPSRLRYYPAAEHYLTDTS